MIHDLDSFKLGESAEDLVVSTSDECRSVAAALARQATRSLDILSQDLDARIYDNDAFLEGLRNIATSSRHATIRILTHETEPAIKHGHRLIETARRLTSAIEIRKVHPNYREHPEAFLIADASGILHRKYRDRYEGIANFRAPNQARMLLQLFDEIWEHSAQDPELRRLHI